MCHSLSCIPRLENHVGVLLKRDVQSDLCAVAALSRIQSLNKIKNCHWNDFMVKQIKEP